MLGQTVKPNNLSISKRDLRDIEYVLRTVRNWDMQMQAEISECIANNPYNYEMFVWDIRRAYAYKHIRAAGISFLGQGVSRVAFLIHATNRVVKVNIDKHAKWQQENEWESWLRNRHVDNSQSRWTLPDMAIVDFCGDIVIVQQYLGSYAPNCDYYSNNPYSVGDLHDGNVREYNGRYYIIDLGY